MEPKYYDGDQWCRWPRGARVAMRTVVSLLLVALLCALTMAPGRADPGPSRFAAGELLVVLRPGWGPQAMSALADGHSVRIVGEIPRLGMWRLQVKPGQELAAAEELRTHPEVLHAEPNYRAWALGDPPNDPYYPLQWNLDKVQAPGAWELAPGAAAAPIAIIDTGVDLSHPDLVGKLWVNTGEIPGNGLDDDHNGYVDDVHGYDFTNGDGDPSDDHGHGTHVAGIAAAATDNGLGVAGMAPASPLMVLKVLDRWGQGTYGDIALGIDYALAHGARVMNLSLAGLDESSVLYHVVQMASVSGAAVIAAAGNCGRPSGCTIDGQHYVNPIFYPAAYDEVLAVGATDRDDVIAAFSEHQPYVDVVAPGLSIFSTIPGTYGYLSGTSMATPHVAGLAGLLWSADPGLSGQELRQHILGNAVDLGEAGQDDYYGWGRIDARSSLCAVIPSLTAVPSTLVFIADDHRGPMPPSETVRITSSCDPLTWTLAISPSSASWVQVTPAAGALAQATSEALRVGLDLAALGASHGSHVAQIQFASSPGADEFAVDIHLHYMDQARQFYLPLLTQR